MTAEFSITWCANCGRLIDIFSRTCNNGRTYNFELYGEKIDPHLDKCLDKEKRQLSIVDPDEDIEEDQEHGKNMEPPDNEFVDSGYLSDPPKKGLPWTEDEHRSFLAGLEKLGRGSWREISKKYVPTRSPTQVASHAQKYFIRKKKTGTTKRRSSLFDIPPNESTDYNNNIDDEYRSSNPECSQMVSFGKVHPLRTCWVQYNTDQAPLPPQHWPVYHGSSQAGVVASMREGDVVKHKID